MPNESTAQAPPALLDLSGLPEPIVRSLHQLVESLRAAHLDQSKPAKKEPRPPLVGRFAHLGISIPKEVLDEAQREAWSGCSAR